MAMLSDWRSCGFEREEMARKNLGNDLNFVAFINQDMNDEYMVTLCDIAIYFKDRNDLFEKLHGKMEHASYIDFSNPEVYGVNGKIEDSPFAHDIRAYLQVHAEETRLRKELYGASLGTRLSRYFGMSATPVPPSSIVERTLEGQMVKGTGITIPVFDPLLAVAVARGKISLDI